MNESPILFSAPMVRATLDGRKTQTRRVVQRTALEWLQSAGFTPEFVAARENDLSPYGYAGDRLWVKETFIAYGRWETRHSEKKGRDEWHFVDMTIECDRAYQYATDDANVPLAADRGGVLPGWHRRPSIFMPRAASRITLEIADVRIQRLQDINQVDAIAEGVERGFDGYHVDDGRHFHGTSARLSYASLWDGLNAERGFAWETNPFVWVVQFRRIQTTTHED